MDTKDASALLQQHRSLTSRLAGRIGRSEAEDLASEAVARGLGRPAPDGRQAPWIERIFRNLVVDRHRQARRARLVALQPWDEFASAASSPAATAEESLLECERRGALMAEIPSIPFDLRDALLARFYEDRDYDDLAATRGISAATARTRVHRALGRLRVALARLRIVFPVPTFGTQSLATALIPVVLTAAVVLPSRPLPSDADMVRVRPRVVLAQAGPVRAKPSQPSFVATAATAATKTTGAAGNGQPPRSADHAQAVPARSPAPHDNAPAAVTHYKFGDDEVVGDLKRPAIEQVVGDPGSARQPSLIEIPRSFLPGIAKMLEDI